jgi:hypothetical protein
VCAYHQAALSTKQYDNLKNHNPRRFRNQVQVRIVYDSNLWQSTELRMLAVFCGYQKRVYE